MIYRTFDASSHNRIANIPSVRATIGEHIQSDAPVDFQDTALDALNWIFLTDGKGAASVFEVRGPCVLDGHVMFAPDCRGREALKIGREMLDWIFANTPVLIITAAPPKTNRGACIFLNRLGFTRDGVRLVKNQFWNREHVWFHLMRDDYEKSNNEKSRLL